jgi:hypothetical protein
MSVFNGLRGFSGKTKDATFVLARSGHPRRRERAAWKARPGSYRILQKTSLALFLNLAIVSSAHFRKSKTQVSAFGKKMSVRQKTTWDASGQTSCAKRDAEYPALPAD